MFRLNIGPHECVKLKPNYIPIVNFVLWWKELIFKGKRSLFSMAFLKIKLESGNWNNKLNVFRCTMWFLIGSWGQDMKWAWWAMRVLEMPMPSDAWLCIKIKVPSAISLDEIFWGQDLNQMICKQNKRKKDGRHSPNFAYVYLHSITTIHY